METLEKANTEVIAKDLDMADELREAADVHMTSYQQRMTNLYNRHVKPRAFQAGKCFLLILGIVPISKTRCGT